LKANSAETSIYLKLATVGIRLAVFYPALTFVNRSLEAFVHPGRWIQPGVTIWLPYLSAAAMGLICLIPYFRVLFRPGVRWLFAAILTVGVAGALRFALLPFAYASPQLANHPQYQQEYENARVEASRQGFIREWDEGGIRLAYVQKPGNSFAGVFGAVAMALVPGTLYLIRRYEVAHGMTWGILKTARVPVVRGTTGTVRSRRR
jgi:hypothetical protein